MEYFRALKTQIATRLEEKSPLIQVVIGPRQVGKTTAIQQSLSGRGIYESADSPTPLPPENIETWWRAAEGKDRILAIDEVQKISGWADAIKKLWDKKKNLKVVLSGSAALTIEKDLRESLAGRFELIRAEHWNFSEANKVFGRTINEFIEFGCYPGSEVFRSQPDRWAAYIRDSIVEPAIGRDLLQLHPVDKPVLLRQLFGLAVSNPAQIISFQKIQGQVQEKGAVATLQNYLHLLSSAFLVSGIQKYSAQDFRSRKSSPKIIVHDNALMRAFERETVGPERFGRYLENAVGARFIEAGWNTYYWSDRDQDVDFVVIGPKNEKWAVEVKSSDVNEKDLKSLRAFVKKHKKFKPVLISLKPANFDGIKTISAEDILNFSRA